MKKYAQDREILQMKLITKRFSRRARTHKLRSQTPDQTLILAVYDSSSSSSSDSVVIPIIETPAETSESEIFDPLNDLNPISVRDLSEVQNL